MIKNQKKVRKQRSVHNEIRCGIVELQMLAAGLFDYHEGMFSRKSMQVNVVPRLDRAIRVLEAAAESDCLRKKRITIKE